MANPSFPRPWGVELLQCLPALGARVVQNSVDLVDERLGLRAVGADTAVDKSLVWHCGTSSNPDKLQNRGPNAPEELAESAPDLRLRDAHSNWEGERVGSAVCDTAGACFRSGQRGFYLAR